MEIMLLLIAGIVLCFAGHPIFGAICIFAAIFL